MAVQERDPGNGTREGGEIDADLDPELTRFRREMESVCRGCGLRDTRDANGMCVRCGSVKHGTSKRPADGGNGSRTCSVSKRCAHLLVGIGVASARNLDFGELPCARVGAVSSPAQHLARASRAAWHPTAIRIAPTRGGTP
jgi:hypothetical protein